MARKGLRYEDEAADEAFDDLPADGDNNLIDDIIEQVMPDVRAIIEKAVAASLEGGMTDEELSPEM